VSCPVLRQPPPDQLTPPWVEARARARRSGTRYTAVMQLRIARLCLDCEEVHDRQRCPVCASDTFAPVTRWVPAPERRRVPRPATSPAAEVYRAIARAEAKPSTGRRLLKQGVLGLTAVGLIGWFVRNAREARTIRSAP
jgi:hypothetical protein